MTTVEPTSPRWGGTTKLVVALVSLVIVAWVLFRFQILIAPLAMAAMLAYLLNPLITFLSGRFRWSRTAASAVVYLVLLLVVAGLATGLGIYIVNQIANLTVNLEQYIVGLSDRIDELTHSRFELFGYAVDLSQFEFASLYAQIINAIEPVLSQAGSAAGQAVTSTAEFFGWALFVLVISFYMAKDMPSAAGIINRYAADPGYHHDTQRLMQELAEIWNDFLRGQALLGIVIGLVSWVGLTILGVRNAVGLALLAGLLELVPTIGPLIAGVVAVIVALFQDSNWLGLDPIVFAIVVAVFFIVVQQLENNFLVPRIIGDTLNLHPVIIMSGAIMGATLAGVIGILLSAPVMASLRVIARYVWRKLLDLPPFLPEEEHHRQPKSYALPKVDWGALAGRFKRPQPSTPPPEPPLNEK